MRLRSNPLEASRLAHVICATAPVGSLGTADVESVVVTVPRRIWTSSPCSRSWPEGRFPSRRDTQLECGRVRQSRQCRSAPARGGYLLIRHALLAHPGRSETCPRLFRRLSRSLRTEIGGP